MIGIFIAVAGLIFGSFLNVCISRLPLHQSIVHPRSRCPRCGAPISGTQNVPVISFLVLRGRCRSCRKTISWRYPAVEISTAALWVLCWLMYGLTVGGVGMAVLSFLLLGLAAMDAETMILPDAFTLSGIGLGILYSGLFCGTFRCSAISAGWAVAAALVLLAISGAYWLVRRRVGIGVGDMKLIAMIAAWLGPSETLLVLVLASVSAAAWGIVLSISRRRLDATIALPFGSFLCAAAIYSSFFGHPILEWYLKFFR